MMHSIIIYCDVLIICCRIYDKKNIVYNLRIFYVIAISFRIQAAQLLPLILFCRSNFITCFYINMQLKFTSFNILAAM